jgi:DNA-binding GntR family transcriptional regulator
MLALMPITEHISPSPDAEEKGLLHSQVAEILRDRIIQSELGPGMRLTERVLCEELKVSRTPLREALKTLASEGLVELLPNRGAIVIPLTLADTTQVFEVLGALEGLAGELACARADDESVAEVRELNERMRESHRAGDRAAYFELNQTIHARLFEMAGNPVLTATYEKLNTRLKRARYSANLSQDRWDAAMDEHEEMLAALEARDAGRLRELMESHMRNKCDVVIGALLSSGTITMSATADHYVLRLKRQTPASARKARRGKT